MSGPGSRLGNVFFCLHVSLSLRHSTLSNRTTAVFHETVSLPMRRFARKPLQTSGPLILRAIFHVLIFQQACFGSQKWVKNDPKLPVLECDEPQKWFFSAKSVKTQEKVRLMTKNPSRWQKKLG
jgi:hypothetical protein